MLQNGYLSFLPTTGRPFDLERLLVVSDKSSSSIHYAFETLKIQSGQKQPADVSETCGGIYVNTAQLSHVSTIFSL